MSNPKKYGKAPYSIAVIHGGPGAPGEMEPIAKELSSNYGVLEPLQTETTIEGQVEELKKLLEKDGKLPRTIIGFSWGAWLSFIVAARYPRFVNKLILVGSGPFEDKYVPHIQETRFSRLDEQERREINLNMEILNNILSGDKNKALERIGELFSKTDSYAPIKSDVNTIECQGDIFQSVWKEASELRRTGKLLEYGKQINCPVIAMHGDYDPHPAEGIQEPLSRIIKDFKFILLKKCGHTPWLEKEAKERFFKELKNML